MKGFVNMSYSLSALTEQALSDLYNQTFSEIIDIKQPFTTGGWSLISGSPALLTIIPPAELEHCVDFAKQLCHQVMSRIFLKMVPGNLKL